MDNQTIYFKRVTMSLTDIQICEPLADYQKQPTI